MLTVELDELIQTLKKTAYGRERQRRSIHQPRDRLKRAPEERQHSAASWRDARRVPPARGAVYASGMEAREGGDSFGSVHDSPARTEGGDAGNLSVT